MEPSGKDGKRKSADGEVNLFFVLFYKKLSEKLPNSPFTNHTNFNLAPNDQYQRR
jgi:hypothetical protein